MERVQEEGGEVVSSSDLRFEVETGVEIDVVYVPPQPNVPAPALAEALSVFARVGAEMVTDAEAAIVAERARKLLG